MPIITITHLPGTLGSEIARRLHLKLGIPLLRKSDTIELLLQNLADPYDIKLLDESPKHFLRNAQNGISFKDNIISGLERYADKKNAIIQGVVPGLFLHNHPNAIHINVTAPLAIRRERLLAAKRATTSDVDRTLEESDRQFRRYGSILFQETSTDPYLYHITVNTGKISVDAAVNIIAEAYKDRLAHEVLVDSVEDEKRVKVRQELSSMMKNESEIQFAKVLDMYHIRWTYEPKTFPLEWDEKGNITKAFSPDFYLYDYNLYLELTVMNPKYSNEKKQKIKQIQLMYPNIQVALVQKKDYQHLLRSLQKANAVDLLSDTGEIYVED